MHLIDMASFTTTTLLAGHGKEFTDRLCYW